MKSKKRDYGVELPPPFIIMNQSCKVWTGLRDGGRRAVFSNNIEDAKETIEEDKVYRALSIAYETLEKIYL